MKNTIFISPRVCYNRDMPQNAEKLSETVLLNLSPTMLEKVRWVAGREDRRLGEVARKLMLRGLALYEKDGRLRDDTGIKSAEVAMTIEPGIDVAERNRIRRELNKPIELPRKRKTG